MNKSIRTIFMVLFLLVLIICSFLISKKNPDIKKDESSINFKNYASFKKNIKKALLFHNKYTFIINIY